MKKLISIGVALALLALVVLPVGVAAADLQPSSNAKIPFAIVQSGFYLVGCLLGDLQPILEGMDVALPFELTDIAPIMFKVGDWAGVPLAWSVDMLSWGVGLMSSVLGVLPSSLGIPTWITDVLDEIVTGLQSCWTPTVCGNATGVYTTCDMP